MPPMAECPDGSMIREARSGREGMKAAPGAGPRYAVQHEIPDSFADPFRLRVRTTAGRHEAAGRGLGAAVQWQGRFELEQRGRPAVDGRGRRADRQGRGQELRLPGDAPRLQEL